MSLHQIVLHYVRVASPPCRCRLSPAACGSIPAGDGRDFGLLTGPSLGPSLGASLPEGPLHAYRARIAAGLLKPDPAQEMAAETLQDLWRRLRG